MSPGSILYRFDSRRALDQAFASGGRTLHNERFCVLREEAFNLYFGDSADLCRELGGRLQGPKHPDVSLLPGGKGY